MNGGFNMVKDLDCCVGRLMKQAYPSTLAACKIPLRDAVSLQMGRQLLEAVKAMHACVYCHMDIKPSNLFVWGKESFLGDYGDATLIGKSVRETTPQYYPSGNGETAQKKNAPDAL